MLAALLMSCAKKHAEFVELPEDQWLQLPNTSKTGSLVYIYRQNSMANIMVSPKMSIDKKPSVKIKNNSYQYVLLENLKSKDTDYQKYVFEIDVANRYTGNHKINVNIKQGEIIYLRLSASLKFENKKDFNRGFNLEKVSKNTAMNEIKTTQYIGVLNQLENKNNKYNAGKDELKSDAKNEGRYSISKTRNPFKK